MRLLALLSGLLSVAGCALAAAASGSSASLPLDLSGAGLDPFASRAAARVFLFVRTDCPITNRYAPELQRLAGEFANRKIEIWLVYPDPSEKTDGIRAHLSAYGFPGTPLRDPAHNLVRRAQVTVAPEAAVFDAMGRLMYHGRIDDLWVSPGKARPVAQTHDLETAIFAVLAGKPVLRAKTEAVGCSLADVQ
jgi:hypothetical protein